MLSKDLLIDFFRNFTAKVSCFVAAVLESSYTDVYTPVLHSASSRNTLSSANFLRGLMLIASLVLSTVAFADHAAYKRGESAFFAYCSGCHSLKYTSYPPLAMPEREALNWFGVLPADLSLIAKYRGQTWLRAYLQGFYSDSSRPFGCNNKLLANTQMPNVLYPLSMKGSYQQTIDDLLVFLMLISEPDKVERYKLGLYVVGFFLFLTFLVWRIYCNYKNT